MRNLYLSNLPVSYRMDFYRSLHRELGCEICFQQAGPDFPGRLWTLRNLPALVKEFRPSMVFVPEFSAAALLCLSLGKRYGFKVISCCDDSLDMIQGHDFGWKHRLAREIVPRLVDGLILHSPEVRDRYRSRFGKGFFMPIIADERRIGPELQRVLPLSVQLRPGKEPLVGFVGRLVGLKNVPTLLRAFVPLKDRARLVLVGEGEERTALEALSRELGLDVLFTGWLEGDTLLAWYNLLDILVLPSTQEAYGAVTGEALMAGAKVVVSRKAGSSGLVREGENGYCVEPDDESGLTERIGLLLDAVPAGRSLTRRENLLPFRFESCMQELINEINML